MAGPEDTPYQNCWVFSQSEDSKKVTDDIESNAVGFVGVREEWIDGDCIVQWASLLFRSLGTSLILLPIHSLSKPITSPPLFGLYYLVYMVCARSLP